MYCAHAPDGLGAQAWIFLGVALFAAFAWTSGLVAGVAWVASRLGLRGRAARGLGRVLLTGYQVLLYIDARTYDLFRYHFNGWVWTVLTTEGVTDSIDLDRTFWIATGAIILGLSPRDVRIPALACRAPSRAGIPRPQAAASPGLDRARGRTAAAGRGENALRPRRPDCTSARSRRWRGSCRSTRDSRSGARHATGSGCASTSTRAPAGRPAAAQLPARAAPREARRAAAERADHRRRVAARRHAVAGGDAVHVGVQPRRQAIHGPRERRQRVALWHVHAGLRACMDRTSRPCTRSAPRPCSSTR